jgi:lantibiotic biosynthesis protein
MKPLKMNSVGQKLDDIASFLVLENNQIKGFGYGNGCLGIALFYLYYGHLKADSTYADKAEELFINAFDELQNEKFEGHFFEKDLAEFGSFIEFTQTANWFDFDSDDILESIDQTLLNHLKLSIERNDFDPFSGALVAGNYYCFRLKNNRLVIPYLEVLIDGLYQQKEVDMEENWFWKSKLTNANGLIYTGLSHGMGAILSLLSNLYENNIQPEICEEMMLKGSRFLISQVKDFEEKGYYFDDIVGQENGVSRLSLCYGDLGVAYGLLRVGKTLKNEEIYAKALSILRDSTLRSSTEQTGVRDAGLLYGACGNAMIYEKIYRLTNDILFKATANYWMQKTLEYGNNENPINAGFIPHLNRMYLATNVGFLQGIAGIGCALIQNARDDTPQMDELIWLL